MPIPPLKVIFAGTPEFAAVALTALIHSHHSVSAVYTQPDRPAGRGLKLTESAVKQVAREYQIPVFQPCTLKDSTEEDRIKHFHADVMVVVAYGLILPAAVLAIPRLGCINIHASLLPRWRGAAPIQRAICAGDETTGISIMQMDTGLDTGPLLYTCEEPLNPTETAQTLHDKLAALGAKALVDALDLLAQDIVAPAAQDGTHATYAHKISKEEALIDWMRPAKNIEHMIRAFNPWPVAHTSWQGKSLRIWKAALLNEKVVATPRTIVHASKAGIDIVAGGGGIIRLLSVQQAGGKIISIADFYNAHQDALKVGEHFI